MYRVRLTYTKSKEAIYIPEKDLQNVFERAMIRAGIYIEYDKNDIPDIEFADNIMLGIDSTFEICDVKLKEHVDTAYMIKSLNRELPTGIVLLTAEYLKDEEKSIKDSCYAFIYEILPNLGDLSQMTNREYEDRKKWYEQKMNEYLSMEEILVLVNNIDRSERINIKEAILNYEILINDALKVTISKDTEYVFNPKYIMDGFNEYVNDSIEYSIKRTKILYDKRME